MFAKYDPEKLTKPANTKVGLVLVGKATGSDYLTIKTATKKIKVAKAKTIKAKAAKSQKIKFGSTRMTKSPSVRAIKLAKSKKPRVARLAKAGSTSKLKVEA